MYCVTSRIMAYDPITNKYYPKILEELSKVADLYVCTHGKENYAKSVINLIDPQIKYFQRHRVNSSTSSKKAKQKSLVDVFRNEIISKYGQINEEEIKEEVKKMLENTIIVDDYKYAWETDNQKYVLHNKKLWLQFDNKTIPSDMQNFMFSRIGNIIANSGKDLYYGENSIEINQMLIEQNKNKIVLIPPVPCQKSLTPANNLEEIKDFIIYTLMKYRYTSIGTPKSNEIDTERLIISFRKKIFNGLKFNRSFLHIPDEIKEALAICIDNLGGKWVSLSECRKRPEYSNQNGFDILLSQKVNCVLFDKNEQRMIPHFLSEMAKVENTDCSIHIIDFKFVFDTYFHYKPINEAALSKIAYDKKKTICRVERAKIILMIPKL